MNSTIKKLYKRILNSVIDNIIGDIIKWLKDIIFLSDNSNLYFGEIYPEIFFYAHQANNFAKYIC